jgi:60 kDa SS-A/Ro ribonucleoprotein
MARLNMKTKPIHTHEGAVAKHITPYMQLRRSVLSTLLWEKQFYEDGEDIAKRICSLIPQVDPMAVAQLAIEARTAMKLRHIPLLIAREMARHPKHKALVSFTLDCIILRPDELTEFLAIYWKDGKKPLSAQVKKGLAAAFTRFNEYSLAKYNRDQAIKLKDVLFLCHAKPKDGEQDALWKKLIAGTLATPDTWEVEISASKDKQASWTRLLTENKLGGLALLRNLRNMSNAGVNQSDIIGALLQMKVDKILPYRFIAAAKHAVQLEPAIEKAMLKCADTDTDKMNGRTFILIDVSGSMDNNLSSKSDLTFLEAACGLAILAREMMSCVEVFTFSNSLVQVPARRGFALRDAIVGSQPHGGTNLGSALRALNAKSYDRIIVITDEQSSDSVGDPQAKGYMINVASNKNGVGYGKWVHVDGFSEAVLNYIKEYEKLPKGE